MKSDGCGGYGAVLVTAVALLTAGAASAQRAAPPAEYRPPAALRSVDASARALVLPPGAPARVLALPQPSAAELAAVTQRREARRIKPGLPQQRSRLEVGFAREIPSPERTLALADLPWQAGADGYRAARLVVQSPGAVALRIGVLLTGALPPGLVVRFQGAAAAAPVHGPMAAAAMAAVTEASPYWSPVLPGDAATLEFALPTGIDVAGIGLEIPLLSHLVADGTGPRFLPRNDTYIGSSGACEVDVACLDATLQQQLKSATEATTRLAITIAGYTYLCSATLVNDTATSFTPYLLMANHCLEDDDPGDPADSDYDPARPARGRGIAAASAATINAYWRYQAATCGSQGVPDYVLQAGGARLLARSGDADWALVRLNQPPPTATTFSAWNAVGPMVNGTAVDALHHPHADLKKASQGKVQGYRRFGNGGSFIETLWSKGVTEVGSSGGGLFTFNADGGYYELRGGLWAGESDCSNPQGVDYFSRLDLAYPLLAPYLAPTASNAAKTTPVVEYYNAFQDAYFITADAFEIGGYDAGNPGGWVRTGYRFLAYTDPAVAPIPVQPVCRLYAPVPWGNTRFYSASPQECADMVAQPALHYTSESAAAFYVAVPDTQGSCPAGTTPVFRFHDNATHPRRRYTAETGLRDALRAIGGWTQEGTGTAPDQVAMCAPAAGTALPLTSASNFQGLWWNGAEPGWGINFAHQGDTIFATWFTYDAAGKPWWLVAETHRDPARAGVYTGPVSTVTGSPFGAVPFDPAKTVETVVGSVTLSFADSDSATFTATVKGVGQTKALTHQSFGPVPNCEWGAQPDLRLATNYTDLWWVPDGAEAGWGINFAHQGDTIFATWFAYDTAGRPAWWIALATRDPARPGVYAGPVSTVTGSPFGVVPFDPAKTVETVVGSATLRFANGNSATFDASVNGTPVTKVLARQVFAAPGTVCR